MMEIINPVEAVNMKEPVITADMEDCDEESEVDMKSEDLFDILNLVEESHKKTYVKCRSIRIGSYKVLMPTERALFIPEGIRISIPPITPISEGDEKELVTIDIPLTKIVKILGHFGRCLPVFFVYVKPSVGRSVRNALKMTDPSGFYFDPCSSDESQTRITILPDKFLESSRTMFRDLYKATTIDDSSTDQTQATSSTTAQSILDELDQKEANEILVRSSPEDLHVKTAVNKKPQENKSPELQSPKGRGRGRGIVKVHYRPGNHQETKPFEVIEVNLDNKKSYKDMKSLKIGSSIKLVNDTCSIPRSYQDKKPSEQVGTRIKLVDDPIEPDEPITRKEPVISPDMENEDNDEEEESEETGDSMPDFGNLAEETLKGPHTSLKCRSLRIGSYKVLMPSERVMFVSKGIRIRIPTIIKGNENEMVTINIPTKSIVKILAHFGRSLPVFFVYVKPSVGRSIRNALKMTDPSGFYFDPCSSDESQKRITILPDKFLETSRSIYKELFNSASKSTTTDASPNTVVIYTGQSQVSTAKSSQNILDEIDQKEANEILILSSPETLPNMNVATVRKIEEKDNPPTSTKKLKSDVNQKSPAMKQRKKQQIIVRGEGNQPIILEVENEEDCDDPLAIEKEVDEEQEPLLDLSIQTTLPQYRKILPKIDTNSIRIIRNDTESGGESKIIENWNKKMEQIKKEVCQSEESDNKLNQTEKTMASQAPIFLSIPPVNSSEQTVFQPKKNTQQKGNKTPNKNGKESDQILQINQGKPGGGNTIHLAPIQLTQGTPQFIMLLPGDKSVGVPVKLLKPP